jgi:hypothetical protein
MEEVYSPQESESTTECPDSPSPADELELYAEDVSEDDELVSTAEAGNSPPTLDLSWEESHLPFRVSQLLSPEARKLWEYYGATYCFGYAPICHQMLEQWHVQFGPLIDAAENISRGLASTSGEDSQLSALLHSMRRLLDDFWAIWEFTRSGATKDPFIRQEFREAAALSEPAIGGES